MSDGTGLHRAICLDPSDVTARLVYSDWLEGEGQAERAEFIRLQVELATYEDCRCNGHCDPCLCNQCALRRRERELFDRGLCAWEAGQVIPNAAYRIRGEQMHPDAPTHLWFWRGFIEQATLRLEDWLAHGPASVLAHPVTTVRATDREPLTGEAQGSTFRWACRSKRPPEGFWELPVELLRLLPNGESSGCCLIRDAQEDWASSISARDYDTAAAAHDALSDALVLWARRKAGLEPVCGTCEGRKGFERNGAEFGWEWVACGDCNGTGYQLAQVP